MLQVRRPPEHRLPDSGEPTEQEHANYLREICDRLHAEDGARFRADLGLWLGLAGLLVVVPACVILELRAKRH